MAENTPQNKPSGFNKRAILQQIAKPLSFLLLLIMVCAFLAHYLMDSETLAEYEQNNTTDMPSSYNKTENTAPPKDSGSKETAILSEENEKNVNKKDVDDNNVNDNDVDNNNVNDNNVNDNNVNDNNVNDNSVNDNEIVNNDPDRITYQTGFYYEPLNDEIKARITGISYPVAESKAEETAVPAINLLADDMTPAVSYDDLCYLSVLHYDFNGEVQTGELICNKALAQDFVEIFYELYRNEYQIERIRLVDEYNGDDTASMADNNTSCFNYRVVDGTTSLSKHALGCAIDINPFYNPYVVYNKNNTGETYISPPGSEIYEDRSQNFPYKIDENDLCYKLFKEHGFTWGGNWNSSKDYQHFQKVPD